MSHEILKVKRLTPHARLPIRGTPGAAGLDLCSASDGRLLPKSVNRFPTDLAMEFPKGCYGRMASRSGLSYRNGIQVAAGVIDPDARGNIYIMLRNHTDKEFLVKKGDRLAQLIIEKYTHTDIQEVQDLSITDRGEKGFGSTGVSESLFNKD
jgi:dUTP pyrophosphatase